MQIHMPFQVYPALVDILDKLMRMDVVSKEAPINDENNKKKSGYFISDNLSLFYYKYIFTIRTKSAVFNGGFYRKIYASCIPVHESAS